MTVPTVPPASPASAAASASPAGAAAPGSAETSPLDAEHLRARVQQALADFFARTDPVLGAISSDVGPLLQAAAEFVLDGGKRLRPAFAYWGWRGAGGADGDQIVTAAASLELLQACALVHDDVMDGSDTRRGRPSVHRRFEAMHRARGWHGSPERFGQAAAVLLGDLYLIWAEQLLRESGLPRVPDTLRVYDEMRVELMAGQYLDVMGQAAGSQSRAHALLVARFKSAKYTIERPLHVGATLAGASPQLVAAYSAFGLPLGEAFQLRDDVLGVFGDPEQTGKPAGDDLREGKRTVLVALAHERADAGSRELIDRLLGDPALDHSGVEALRAVIVETEALAEVERLIAARVRQALAALESPPVAEPARAVLGRLAAAATSRQG